MGEWSAILTCPNCVPEDVPGGSPEWMLIETGLPGRPCCKCKTDLGAFREVYVMRESKFSCMACKRRLPMEDMLFCEKCFGAAACSKECWARVRREFHTDAACRASATDISDAFAQEEVGPSANVGAPAETEVVTASESVAARMLHDDEKKLTPAQARVLSQVAGCKRKK